MKSLSIDQANIILMLLSAAVAYAIPFELVLISYAFLGPAHYLTEISWLHDRDYFTGTRWIWMPLTILVAALLAASLWMAGNIFAAYFISCAAFSLAASFALTRDARLRGIIFSAFLALFLLIRTLFPAFEMAWAVLLPTVIHIFVFTGIFILLGALRGKSKWGLASFAVFLACGLSYIWIVPSTMMISSDFVDKNLGYFDGLTDYMVSIASFGGLVNGHSVLAFLSFAYTYHYLNWFSKTEVIKWHLIPRQRLYGIIALYAFFVSIVLVDFMAGLVALTFLSVAHVFLEFPLNVLSIRDLGRYALRRA